MEKGCAAAHDTSLFICSNKSMGLSLCKTGLDSRKSAGTPGRFALLHKMSLLLELKLCIIFKSIPVTRGGFVTLCVIVVNSSFNSIPFQTVV